MLPDELIVVPFYSMGNYLNAAKLPDRAEQSVSIKSTRGEA
jgi:hypothetical protein